jgi:hypothetical protein
MPAKKKFDWRPYIRNAARKAWLWSPVRREAIALARVSKGVIRCAKCDLRMAENAKPKPYNVDHIDPAANPASLSLNWHEWLHALLDATVADVQVLCKGCHGEKTKAENSERKRLKSLAKSPRAKRVRKVAHSRKKRITRND